MKYLPLLTLPALLVSFCLKAQTTLPATSFGIKQLDQPETITSPLREGLDQKRAAEKSYTLGLPTNQPGGGNEVRLPSKLDPKTIAVFAGGAPLAAGKDYVFLSDLNSIRILNQKVLTSGDRLYISYKFLF